MDNKKVYFGLTADTFHHGHINLIEKAREYGTIIVGLLTDEAIANHKSLPILNYEQRKKIIENIRGVSKVVPQNEWDYSRNIIKYKPEYMIHGDDWTQGPQLNLRKNAINALKKHGGKLIELPYTKGTSSTALDSNQTLLGTTPENRLKKIKKIFSCKTLVKIY